MLFKCKCYLYRYGDHPKGNRIGFGNNGAVNTIGKGIGYKKYFHRHICNKCHRLLGYPFFDKKSYYAKYSFLRSSDWAKIKKQWRKYDYEWVE